MAGGQAKIHKLFFTGSLLVKAHWKIGQFLKNWQISRVGRCALRDLTIFQKLSNLAKSKKMAIPENFNIPKPSFLKIYLHICNQTRIRLFPRTPANNGWQGAYSFISLQQSFLNYENDSILPMVLCFPVLFCSKWLVASARLSNFRFSQRR